jgi:predicted CopG family antitoxin
MKHFTVTVRDEDYKKLVELREMGYNTSELVRKFITEFHENTKSVKNWKDALAWAKNNS